MTVRGRRATSSSPRSRRSDDDILLPKKHPSAFFGTPLASYLIELRRRHAGGDRLHDQRLRARLAWSMRSPTISAWLVPHDAVYDRSQTSHAVNLFDMAEKYADVMPRTSWSRGLRSSDAVPAP